MQLPTYTKTGSKASTNVSLSSDLISKDISSTDLLKKAYLADLANKRSNPAKAKTRTEVRGGGRKPWRQKGTGNARAGSIRSPLWRGGGITFGPTGYENYQIVLSKKETTLSLKQAIGVNIEKFCVVDADFSTFKKTKEAAKLIFKVSNSKNTLLVLANEDVVPLSVRNIKEVKSVKQSGLNVRLLMDADKVIFSKKSLAELDERVHKGETK